MAELTFEAPAGAPFVLLAVAAQEGAERQPALVADAGTAACFARHAEGRLRGGPRPLRGRSPIRRSTAAASNVRHGAP